MGHVLFLENRHQTKTWQVIASGLRDDGHTISWLVMNHGFAPREANIRLLAYPRKRDLTPAGDRFSRIIESDRGIRYYGTKADHYIYYDRQIRLALKEIQPEIVVGEATQFYELLTIEACRDLGIPYIVPTSARYPTGRFLCYEYDTLNVVGGSGEFPGEEELSAFVRQLAKRTIVPDYMKDVASRPKAGTSWNRRRDWAYKALQFARGERYSSPSPWKKLFAERAIHRNFEAWNQRAQVQNGRMMTERKIRVLFPLHMQPEASVDVWGRPYSDQAALIEEMADAIVGDGVILVKPNPKPKCELSGSLLDLVSRHAAVVPLASTVSMHEAFENAELIVTVTGTVALEAIFARKPCCTLIRTRNNDLEGCRHLASPAQLGEFVKELRSGCFPMHTEETLMAFAARLYVESYPGIIQDPISTPQAGSKENKRRLTNAMNRLIPEILSGKQERISYAAVPAEIGGRTWQRIL